MSKSKSGVRKARQYRNQLTAIWKKHGFTDKPPLAVQKLARELCIRLNVPIVIGTKLAKCVIDFDGGCALSEKEKTRLIKPRNPEPKNPTKSAKAAFYASWEWRTLRMEVLKQFGARCMCCGATPEHKDMAGNAVKIVVDHIKPLHHHWGLRLQKKNLQILCDECNQGKGAWDETDHRTPPAPDEWLIEDEIPVELRQQLSYSVQ